MITQQYCIRNCDVKIKTTKLLKYLIKFNLRNTNPKYNVGPGNKSTRKSRSVIENAVYLWTMLRSLCELLRFFEISLIVQKKES